MYNTELEITSLSSISEAEQFVSLGNEEKKGDSRGSGARSSVLPPVPSRRRSAGSAFPGVQYACGDIVVSLGVGYPMTVTALLHDGVMTQWRDDMGNLYQDVFQSREVKKL